MKKILSVGLILAMVLSLCSFNIAFAEEAAKNPYSPILINTADEWGNTQSGDDYHVTGYITNLGDEEAYFYNTWLAWT